MLVTKTLRTLQRGNYTGLLWLVVPSDELPAYQAAVAGNAITTMILHCPKGLIQQRNYFREQMLPGTEIVFIDDDVEAIKIKTPSGLSHCTNIIGLANYVFGAMAERGDCLLAGVYPMANRDWMRCSITEGSAYCVGALYFCKEDVRLKEPDFDELEDWYRCISEQAAGRPVLRFNFIGIQTKYFKNAGGMQTARTDERRKKIVDQYANQFSSLIKSVTRRNGKLDLKFITKPILTTLTLPVDSLPAVPELSAFRSTAGEDPA